MVDVTANIALHTLYAENLPISNIDLTANISLKYLSLMNNDNLISVTGIPSSLEGIVYRKKTSTTAGMMISFSQTYTDWSSARSWCSNYGSGWYLPSISELKTIRNNSNAINKVLSASGRTSLSNGVYWSSTSGYEYNTFYQCLDFSNYTVNENSKSKNHYVCAVLAF